MVTVEPLKILSVTTVTIVTVSYSNSNLANELK